MKKRAKDKKRKKVKAKAPSIERDADGYPVNLIDFTPEELRRWHAMKHKQANEAYWDSTQALPVCAYCTSGKPARWWAEAGDEWDTPQEEIELFGVRKCFDCLWEQMRPGFEAAAKAQREAQLARLKKIFKNLPDYVAFFRDVSTEDGRRPWPPFCDATPIYNAVMEADKKARAAAAYKRRLKALEKARAVAKAKRDEKDQLVGLVARLLKRKGKKKLRPTLSLVPKPKSRPEVRTKPKPKLKLKGKISKNIMGGSKKKPAGEDELDDVLII